MSRRVIVTGGRTLTDRALVDRVLDLAHAEPITRLVHGGAEGLDTLAGLWAFAHDVPVTIVPADWDTYGRGAGPIRNKVMAQSGADLCIVFPGGPGTDNMRQAAKREKIPIFLVPTWLTVHERLAALPAAAERMALSGTPVEQKKAWAARQYQQKLQLEDDLRLLLATLLPAPKG